MSETVLLQAKSVLERCQELLKEATKRNEQTIEQTLKPASSKKERLLRVFNEIQNQIGVIQNLLLSLKSKSQTILVNIHDFQTSCDKTMTFLRAILLKLAETRIHVNLTSKSQDLEETIEKNTLYDYVNSESVDLLQKKGILELKEIDLLEQGVKEHLHFVDVTLEELRSRDNRVFQMDQLDHDPENFNRNEIENVVNTVLEVAGYYDKIQYLLTNAKIFGNVSFEKKDLVGLQSSIEKECNYILENCSRIENRAKEMSEFYVTVSKQYTKIEKISLVIPNRLSEIDGLEIVFNQHVQRSTPLFDEMRDLSEWYRLFHVSFENLLVEIDRRHQSTKKMDEYIKQVNEKLSTMSRTETDHRKHFAETYGIYLPQSLYPSIRDPVTKISVYPESLKSSLPDVYEVTKSK